MVTNKTTLNMVIGYPLEHTQSPILHNAIYDKLNIDSVLLAFAHPEPSHLVETIKTLKIGLTAITMPHKEMIIPYLNHRSEAVRTLKATNTIIQKNGELWGYNTDIDGIEYALKDTELSEKNVLIIGAGGAARAMGYVLNKHQANIYWLNRTPDKALTLIEEFGGQATDHFKLNKLAIDVIINTTPLGMFPNINQTPLNGEFFKPNQTVFDMIYNPLETKFLTEAKMAGAKTISGLEMFIAQGIKQISLWQDKDIHSDEINTLAREILSLSMHHSKDSRKH
jgi:shikimate dehydrogenase